MPKTRRFVQTETFQDRLQSVAENIRAQVKALPPGTEKDALLRKARQVDTASHINESANSSGLQPPK